MPTPPLTVERIQAEPLPANGTKDLWGASPVGFHCRLSAGGRAAFRFFYRTPDGEKRSPTLRDPKTKKPLSWPRDRLTKKRLEHAQRAAFAMEDAVLDGADPHGAEMEGRRRAKAAGPDHLVNPTFGEAVDSFIDTYAKPRQRSWRETQRILTRNCEPWAKRRLKAIGRGDVQDLLDSFRNAGTPYKAVSTRAWLNSFFRWAAAREYVPENFMSKIELHVEKGARTRVYSDDELRALWQAADALDPVEGGFVKLLMLTAVRKNEAAGMRRSELDDPERPTLWIVPWERTKARKSTPPEKRRPYVVPLSPLAQRVLRGMPRFADDLIFPGRAAGPMVPGTWLQRKVARAANVEGFNFHALRHSAATWAQDEGASTYERALLLNHSEGSVTAIYSHSPAVKTKRKWIDAWGAHIEAVISEPGSLKLR